MSIIHKKWHQCCLHTHKSVMCIQRQHRLHFFFFFAICSLIFQSKSLMHEHLCWGGGGGGLAIFWCSFSRALRSQTSCLSFSAARQQLHDAEAGRLPLCDQHSRPGTVRLSATLFRSELLWRHTVPETGKTKQYRMFHYSRSMKKHVLSCTSHIHSFIYSANVDRQLTLSHSVYLPG